MNPKILLVEDHPESSSAMARLLRLSGYDVETASCYCEAVGVATAARSAFDLLISDIGLPDGNGCALLRELRERCGLEGIAVTGYGSPWDVAEIKRAGFLHHFIKPVDFKSLRTAVEDSVARLPRQISPVLSAISA